MPPKKCCHCFENVNSNKPSIHCDACKYPLHVNCLEMSTEEKKLITNVKSANIKIFCDRCNVSLSAISEVKASVDELKAIFESRLEQLENLIKQSTLAPNEKESVINESVERSWRARNVIIYNVDSCEEKRDVDIVNDILKVCHASLVVDPGSVARIGTKITNKPKPLKVSFNTPDMARLCLRKKGNLIHHAQFSKILIRDDKTPLQIKHLQSLREELNIMRQQGDDTATIKYVHNIPQIVNKKN
jgi:hypothetical protein